MVVLANIPAPEIVETLDYEAIVTRKKTTFGDLWEAVRTANPSLNLPTYDVSMLESDPAVIIIEADAYDELLLRARVNDALRSNLLAYSVGADLDNLAADHGVTRLTGESDAALRERIILADQGRSTAGPEEWYEFHARSADVRVRDAKVYRPGPGPEINVAILSTVGDGTPTSDLLAAVLAAVSNSSVRSLNDIIAVESAVKTTVNVTADVWLLPETPMSVFDGLEAGLRATLVNEGGIGFDVNTNWIDAKLTPAGVSRVTRTAPVAHVTMAENAAAVFGTITLTYKGRSR
jgi:phage-related baseplate assembly protein